MLKIGIVGTGGTVGIAQNHLNGIINDGRAEVCAVYNRHAETAKNWIEKNGLEAEVCLSFEDLLNKVDAVIICTPNNTHFEYAKRAILSGKHVLLEKPMAINAEKSYELSKLASRSNTISMVGFVYRYSSVVNSAKKLVQEKIGNVYTVSAWAGGTRLANPNNPFEWRMNRSLSGSGALGDFGSHLVDLAYYVAGQKYDKVNCLTETFIKTRKDGEKDRLVENDDSAVLCATGSNGLGNFALSRVGHEGIRMHVAGEGGMLELSLAGEGSLLFWNKDSKGCYVGSFEKIEFEKQIPFQGWFNLEIKDFIDSIEGISKTYPDFAEGCYVDSVLFAAEQSHISEKTISVSL